MSDSNCYLAYFDTMGFECVINITEAESDVIMATLRNETAKLPFNLTYMKLRARYNPQRSPEIWSFNVDAEIDHSSVVELSKEHPQYLADFIRKNGKKIYGSTTVKQVIV